MDVTVVESTESQWRATISGELDADNCSDVGSELLKSTPSTAALVIDASDLAFIDSSGISELLRVRDALDRDGGSLTLENPTDSVRRVLEITGLLEAFGLA